MSAARMPRAKDGQSIALACRGGHHDFKFAEFTTAPFWTLVPFFEERPGQIYEVSPCTKCNAFTVRPVGRDSDEVATT